MPCTVSRSRPWAAAIFIALFSQCALSVSVNTVGISPHGMIEGEPRRLLRKETKESADDAPVVASGASNATAPVVASAASNATAPVVASAASSATAAAVVSSPPPSGNATVEEDVEAADAVDAGDNVTVAPTSDNTTVTDVPDVPLDDPIVPHFTEAGENSSVEMHPPKNDVNDTESAHAKRPMDTMCEAEGNATAEAPNGALAVCPADLDCMKWMLEEHGDNYTMKTHRATCCCVPKSNAKPGEECYICGCMKSCDHGCPYDADVEDCRR